MSINKASLYFLLFFSVFISCSPYKKVVITMSEIQTKNWIGKSEKEVLEQMGQYKKKELLERGYKLIYDYSSYRMPTKNDNFPVHVSNNQIVNNQGNLMVARTDTRTGTMGRTNPMYQQLEVVHLKMLEFYIDKDKKVDYVFAMGYPDSIRYELKKK